MKYPKPKVFKPTEKDVKEAMNKVAEHLSNNKLIGSSDYPELKVRGKRKTNS